MMTTNEVLTLGPGNVYSYRINITYEITIINMTMMQTFRLYLTLKYHNYSNMHDSA